MTRAIGPLFVVNAPSGRNYQSSVTALSNGWFAVAWLDSWWTPDLSYDYNQTSLQIVDAYGSNIGTELKASGTSHYQILDIHIQDQGSGKFLISHSFTDLDGISSYQASFFFQLQWLEVRWRAG
jgi:hypothetical protein